jgi:hypothetical protein
LGSSRAPWSWTRARGTSPRRQGGRACLGRAAPTQRRRPSAPPPRRPAAPPAAAAADAAAGGPQPGRSRAAPLAAARARAGQRRARPRAPAHVIPPWLHPGTHATPLNPPPTHPFPQPSNPQLHELQQKLVHTNDEPLVGLSEAVQLAASHLNADLAA